MKFKKAIKHNLKVRLALVGGSGSGKTFTAMKIASILGQKVAVIDTEHCSASRYADQFDFDVCELNKFSPANYTSAINEAGAHYDVLIIDSLSHAWTGSGGALEMKDNAAKRPGNNGYTAWREVTPIHNQMVDAILSAPCHIIVTMRAKTEYVMEEYQDGEKTKVRPVKIGLAPIQREGLDYEFDIVGDMTYDNDLIVGKTRCSALAGKIFCKPGKDFVDIVSPWLQGNGEDPEIIFQELIKKVRLARLKVNITRDEVLNMMQKRYGHQNLRELSLEQGNVLVQEILASQSDAA